MRALKYPQYIVELAFEVPFVVFNTGLDLKKLVFMLLGVIKKHNLYNQRAIPI